MTIEENAKARSAAEMIEELAVEESKGHGPRFWTELAKRIVLRTPTTRPRRKARMIVPMDDGESKRFGAKKLPFGKCVGQRVDDVPSELLQWYADQTFTDELRRYLLSDRIRRESHN